MRAFITLSAVVAVLLSGCATTIEAQNEKYSDLTLDSFLADELKDRLIVSDQGANVSPSQRLKKADLVLSVIVDDKDALTQKAQAQFELGRYDKSLSAYQKLEVVNKIATPDTHQGIGLNQLALGHKDLAESRLKQAVKMDDRLWRSWNGLGLISAQNGQSDQALNYFNKAILLNPSNDLLKNNLAQTYLAMGEAGHALKVYESFDTQSSPKYIGHRISMALTGRHNAALMTANDYEKAYVYNELGENALRNNKNTVAVQYLKKAIAVNPTYFEKAEENLRKARAATSF